MKRYAYTMIDTLVAIAIIALLIGLSLPAIQGTRETANQCSCKNNLKQYITAVHSYENSHGRFPSSTNYVVAKDATGRYINPGWNYWMEAITPYLQGSVYKGQIYYLLCPTNSNGYAAADSTSDGVVAFGPVGKKVTEIIDGMSNTLAIGEAYGVKDNAAGARSRDRTTWLPVRMRTTTQTPEYIPRDYPGWPASFSGPHRSGVIATFADGATRTIKYTINVGTFRAMGTCNGGEILQEDM